MFQKLSGARVLITGGDGFVGSHLVLKCLAQGASVCVIASKEAHCQRLVGLPVVIKRTLYTTQKAIMRSVLDFNPNYIFHVAAKVKRSQDIVLFEELYASHVTETVRIVTAAQQLKSLERFIHVGTIEEYGFAQTPFEEGAREQPVTPYSLTKFFGTKYVEFVADRFNFPAVVIRPSLVYGPQQRVGMFITNLITACIEKKNFKMSPGEQARDFLYIDDLVDGLIMAAVTPGINGQIINLGSGVEIPIRDIAQEILYLFKNSIEIEFGAIPYRADERMSFWVDTKKAQRLLQWKPRINISEGLKRTVDSYLANIK